MKQSLEELAQAEESTNFTKTVPHELYTAKLDFSDERKIITYDKTIKVCFSPKELEENAVVYLATLTYELQKYSNALSSEPSEALGRLRKFERRNSTLSSDRPFFTRLYHKMVGAKRVKKIIVSPYEEKVLNYQLLKETFSDEAEHLQSIPSIKREQYPQGTKNDIVMAIQSSTEIAKRYWQLDGYARKQRAAQERWYYHYFPNERGRLSLSKE